MDDKFYLTLIDRFEKSAMSELDFTNDKVRLVLRKGGAGTPSQLSHVPPQVAAHMQSGAAAAHNAASLSQEEINKIFAQGAHHDDSPAASKTDAAVQTVTSPIVATFYASPSPDAPPFVKKGDKVKKGQTLCILEAMKMMNNLEAEFDCEIVAIKAAPGDLVEFGQVLFEVKKR